MGWPKGVPRKPRPEDAAQEITDAENKKRADVLEAGKKSVEVLAFRIVMIES